MCILCDRCDMWTIVQTLCDAKSDVRLEKVQVITEKQVLYIYLSCEGIELCNFMLG